MKIVLQRVSKATVTINRGPAKSIGHGLVALVGIAPDDTQEIVDYLVEKMIHLRIFNDNDGNFNHSLIDLSGELLLVSNFTLYANSKKGRRPSFTEAAHPDFAVPIYEYMVKRIKALEIPLVTGEFGGDMEVAIINDGPVTIILDSEELLTRKGDRK